LFSRTSVCRGSADLTLTNIRIPQPSDATSFERNATFLAAARSLVIKSSTETQKASRRTLTRASKIIPKLTLDCTGSRSYTLLAGARILAVFSARYADEKDRRTLTYALISVPDFVFASASRRLTYLRNDLLTLTFFVVPNLPTVALSQRGPRT